MPKRVVVLVPLFLAVLACSPGEQPGQKLRAQDRPAREVPPPPVPKYCWSHLNSMEPAELRRVLLEEHPTPETLSHVAYDKLRDEAAGFMKSLHALWKKDEGRQPRTNRLFLRALTERLLDLDENPEGQKLRDEIIKAGLAGESRRETLSALAASRGLQLEPLGKEVLFPAMNGAPEAEQGAWGRVLVNIHPSPQITNRQWAMVAAACKDALDTELAGRADIHQVPWFGGSPENAAREFRISVARRAREEWKNGALDVAPGLIAMERSPSVLDAWAQGIGHLDAAQAGAEAVVRAALAADHSQLRIAAMRWIKGTPAAVKLAEALKQLTSVPRKDVSDCAREILGDAAKDVPPPARFILSPESAAKILSLAQFDLKGARRAKALALQHSEWGGSGWSEQKMPGWLLTAPGATPQVFVSDELDWSEGTAEQLQAEVIDFDAETTEAIKLLDNPPKNDDDKAPVGFHGRWVIGHDEHNLFRLLFLVQLESAKGDYTRSSALYSRLIADYDNERAMQEYLAYNIAWLRFSNAVHAHAVCHDDLARLHAQGMIKLQPWTKPQTNFSTWIRDCQAILADLEARKVPYAAKDESKAEYWVERLPDVVLRQMGQPGGVDFDPEDRIVHDKLTALGLDALMPLAGALDRQDRLTRGCGFWRNFHRSRDIHTVGEIAQSIMREIIEDKLKVTPVSELYEPANREILVNWLKEAIAAAK